MNFRTITKKNKKKLKPTMKRLPKDKGLPEDLFTSRFNKYRIVLFLKLQFSKIAKYNTLNCIKLLCFSIPTFLALENS